MYCVVHVLSEIQHCKIYMYSQIEKTYLHTFETDSTFVCFCFNLQVYTTHDTHTANRIPCLVKMDITSTTTSVIQKTCSLFISKSKPSILYQMIFNPLKRCCVITTHKFTQSCLYSSMTLYK